MKYIILLSLLILNSCSDYPMERVAYEYAIPDSNVLKAEHFMIEICRVSNPNSDEEPEDMIKQAERTVMQLYGVQTIGIYFQSEQGDYIKFIPYWDLSPRQKLICDKYLIKGRGK